MPRVLGLDICKSSVVACLLTEKPTEPRQLYYDIEFLTLSADAAGIKQMLELKPDVAIMEPTGVNYARLWGTHLARAGVEVRLVSNNKLPSYRSELDLPDKDDEADALALACYYFDYKDSPRRFVQIREQKTARLRELALRLAHYNRVQSPIINRLRQDLAWQMPEVMNVQSKRSGDNLPLLWGWMAGERKSAKYDKLHLQTVGTGITQETRFAAKMLCDLQLQERLIELEATKLMMSDSRFFPYRKVFTSFGFGLRTQFLLLSQIFPLENYLNAEGRPEVIIRKGKNSKKPTKRYFSERRFMKALGAAPVREWSGDEKKKSKKAGSSLCRQALWQWLFTRIEVRKSRVPSFVGELLGEMMDEAKAQKQPIKLVRSRLVAKAVRMLFKELVKEICH
ncbi:IS110 family transposase [Kamptonema formosum]|uniref:IS110 family transposase n=1 Tax=Kamptonema formosum TaxID=331992 RepID=UPI000348145E|nr:transposase [Kamptonema formosum]